MNIIELKAQNFKRLKAVTIRPNGALVVISGKNDQGKTSALEAIWACLKGRAAVPPVPIRAGEEEARLRLDLGELVVERKFKREDKPGAAAGEFTTDLKVTLADGSRVMRTPQAVLDAMLGDLTFDPLAFAKADAKTQVESLKRLVPGFDFAANEQARRKAFDERTDVARSARQEVAVAAKVELPPGPRPAPIDVSAKIDELQRAGEHNAEIERRKERRQAAQREIDDCLDEAERLRARAATLEKRAGELGTKLGAAETLPEPIDVAALRAEIGEAEKIKGAINLHDLRERHEKAAAELEVGIVALTKKIAELDAAKAAAVAAAKLPVPGLEFGDDAVTLNGVPFSQAGTAVKIEVSTAIAMAMNPKIRVVLIDEGSELDREHVELLAKLAAERGYQVWMCRVDETGKVGFVIEDGELAG